MKSLTVIALLSLTLSSACGTTIPDRAISGGVIGAGVGAVGGALLGMPGLGIIIGGSAGAVGGATTRPEDFNLGTPIWRH